MGSGVVSGDEATFRRVTDKHARELHLHCYRMLGSLDEADDALQETLLLAWRHLGGFQGRSPLRAWLYRIATNVCLKLEAGRRARAIATADVIQSPYPDRLLDELPDRGPSPAARYDLQESVRLAFLAAIHHLPARQRAVLILRDVLGFSAAEVAACLDTTRASVNSALQRARAALDREPPRPAQSSTKGEERELVSRFVDAWERVDIDGLVSLLAEDVVMEMPPFPEVYRGRAALGEFFATVPAGGALDEIRLVETRANRQPALAAYMLDPEAGVYRGYGIMVLDVRGAAIAEIDGFAFATLLPVFGLPTELPG